MQNSNAIQTLGVVFLFNQKRDTHLVYTNLHTIWWQPKTNKESPVKNIHVFIRLSRLKQKHVYIRLSVNSCTDLDIRNRCRDTPAWPLTPSDIYPAAEDKKDCDQGTVYLQKIKRNLVRYGRHIGYIACISNYV